MKLVIDLQAAQSESRHRGIGRYASTIVKAFVESPMMGHEIWIAANAHLGHMESIRSQFDGLIPQDRIVSFSTTGSTVAQNASNNWRRKTSELLREDFLRGIGPDLVWTTSLFEGWVDDTVTSIGLLPSRCLHAITLYDLIPLANSDDHLVDARVRSWYYRKLGHLKRADMLLAISEFARNEALDLLNIPSGRVVNVSSAASDCFRKLNLAEGKSGQWRAALGIKRPFVFYMGGFDDRKNVSLLIKACALLPADIRRGHCVVLGGRINDEQRIKLRALARDCGLSDKDLLFTGQISDDDLVMFYNLCELFVFPSLQEGFGLPVLEAMACGAPVLAARTTSLPEVVGRDDMLFDPADVSQLTREITDILQSPELRAELGAYGLQQAQSFSWQRSAQSVRKTFERMVAEREACASVGRLHALACRPRLAYVSPLPPEKTGVADYSAELLPDLGRYYDIDIVVEQPVVSNDWVDGNYPVRDAAWFDANAWQFDRILYQFGNSPFHTYQLYLMRNHPGTVVLHDSFVGAFSAWRASAAGQPDEYLQRLYRAHGYRALLDDKVEGRAVSIARYPSSLEIFHCASGVLVHSQYAIDQAKHFYGDRVTASMKRVAFPKRRRPADRLAARAALGLDRDDFVVCSFGLLAPTKLNERLLSAWLGSTLAKNRHCHLVFVGENHGGDYGQALSAQINADAAGARIRITGFVKDSDYRAWLGVADLAVQLRTESRGETSAAVFDCMAQGVPLIVNAHATFAELDAAAVLMMPDQFSDEQLIDLLQKVYEHPDLRRNLSQAAQSRIDAFHLPDAVALQYRDAIEQFAAVEPLAREREVARAMAKFSEAGEEDLWRASVALSRNHAVLRQRQLFVDVTAIARHDLKTGIERVTRSITYELLQQSTVDTRVEPIRFHGGRYVYARSYALGLLGIDNPGLPDEPVEVSTGDVFFGLDWAADVIPGQVGLFQSWRDRGVAVYFAVYDLLPVQKPLAFPPGTEQMHAHWLRSIAQCADGLCCISRTVADELILWLGAQDIQRERPLRIGYWHLGAEFGRFRDGGELPPVATDLLDHLGAESVVIMVGTIEPRKGHAHALDAFELLWEEGSATHLLIVGKQGWMSEALVARIKNHPMFGKQLHWPADVSDTYLDRLYEVADVLLAASEGEGFGLPLIEAAQRRVPIIARDLPVFREVAGKSACYFPPGDAAALAATIRQWFELAALESVPLSTEIEWSSWRDSAATVAAVLSDPGHGHWLYAWESKCGVRNKVGPLGLILPMNRKFHGLSLAGWAQPEPWGCWVVGHTAKLNLQLAPTSPKVDLRLRLHASAFLHSEHPEQSFEILVCGKLLGRWTCNQEDARQEWQWTIPASWLDGEDQLVLTILQHDSVSPHALGLSTDSRQLGLAVREIRLDWILDSEHGQRGLAVRYDDQLCRRGLLQILNSGVSPNYE